MPYISPTEHQNMLLQYYRADEIKAELTSELENYAIAVHVLRRELMNETERNGHTGSYKDCPSYECVKARQLIKKSRGAR